MITDERRWELEDIRATKKHAELEGFEWSQHGHGGGSRLVPRVVPIGHGKCLAVYPDDDTLAVMNGWTMVTVGFGRNGDGEVAELALLKSVDGTGVNIRHYDHQRTNIHVTVARHGRAVAKPDGAACSVKRVGDAFVFDILSQVSIVPYGDNDDSTGDNDDSIVDDGNDDGDGDFPEASTGGVT